MALSVAIAGASGYVGGELMRLVADHPELELRTVTAQTNVGEKVSALHPGNRSHANLEFVATNKENLLGHDLVFLALPHSTSAAIASQLESAALVIDCGADFRLEDPAAWGQYYGTEHAGTWSYGLPELTLATGGKLRGQLRSASRIAVPGCNVTAISLALAPALTAGLIEPQGIVSVLAVGTSGAGRALQPQLLASEVMGSASAYGVGGIHRHTPEIEQNLSKAAGAAVTVSFTPILVPMTRGIIAVNNATPKAGVSLDDLRAVYQQAYGDENFIELLPAGEFPATASVLGTNMASIGLALDSNSGQVVIVSAIDNLVKGTAGAAIQSMNLAVGFIETLGLERNGLTP
jgi:N-acetyl-gamma-glutamyl-phosphate reductase